MTGNSDYFYFDKAELDSIEFKNTLQVLEFYNEEYKIKNENVILITKKLSKDSNLLMNYTKKANDLQWINSHFPNK